MIDWTQLKSAEQVADELRRATVPQVISRAQGKVALNSAGLWESVQAFVATLSPTDRALAEVALNDTTEWRRDSPFLAQCAAQIGLTDADLDDLFTRAAAIVL